MIESDISAGKNAIGHWMEDEWGLPCFSYTGILPFEAKLKDGQKVKLPDDPWFLLGNYRLTLFTHISGNFQLITGQRAWGRLNQGDVPNSGCNSANIELRGNDGETVKTYRLTGTKSLASDPDKCTRVFGCGFADYVYRTDEIICKRTLSVKPSTNPYNGISAFLVTVKFTNKCGNKISFAYNESVAANYEATQQQRKPADKRKVRYLNAVSINEGLRIIKSDIQGITDDPLQFPTKNEMSQLDGFPPTLFMKATSAKGNPRFIEEKIGAANILTARFELALKPDEEKTIEFIIGYSFEGDFKAIEKSCRQMMKKSVHTGKIKHGYPSGAAYGGDWLKVLPAFDGETDKTLKLEMVWHAYNLEAMATYSEYYGQTKIPQGTIYDYDWGVQCSARDHFQHALPLCYYNPALARSVLKYLMKRTTPWGEIRLIEFGNGFSHAYSYFTSDQQLFYFLLLAEYLRITKDHDFLLERVEYYPVKNMPKGNSLDFIERCYKFLRDEIGTGPHGLVRLMNSDWNDAVFYIVKEPYNRVLYTGESHMNSAMVIKILGDLVPILQSLQKNPEFEAYHLKIGVLAESMTRYRKGVLDSFMKDLADRNFSRRMYFAGKSYGDDNMFLEPQGYMMQMNEISVEKKKALYEEMKKCVYPGEKLGARQQQIPEFEDNEFDKGSRENGGFWYALNGPVVLGVAQFDRPEAMMLLKKMTFDNYAKSFPDYWSSYWSASDNIESSLIPVEGLPDQTTNLSDIPVYCAHSHAWLLYCYYYLNNLDG